MSTKSTLLYGKNFHLYRDAFDYLPTLEVNHKKVDLPEDFMEAILKLVLLHESCKSVIDYTQWLDEIDGGLFAISLKKGSKDKEFRKGKFVNKK